MFASPEEHSDWVVCVDCVAATKQATLNALQVVLRSSFTRTSDTARQYIYIKNPAPSCHNINPSLVFFGSCVKGVADLMQDFLFFFKCNVPKTDNFF